MYNRLKRLYDAGRISEKALAKAVELGYITQEEMDEITGENNG